MRGKVLVTYCSHLGPRSSHHPKPKCLHCDDNPQDWCPHGRPAWRARTHCMACHVRGYCGGRHDGCVHCYVERSYPKQCASCDEMIRGPFLRRGEAFWCERCRVTEGDQKPNPKNDRIQALLATGAAVREVADTIRAEFGTCSTRAVQVLRDQMSP